MISGEVATHGQVTERRSHWGKLPHPLGGLGVQQQDQRRVKDRAAEEHDGRPPDSAAARQQRRHLRHEQRQAEQGRVLDALPELGEHVHAPRGGPPRRRHLPRRAEPAGQGSLGRAVVPGAVAEGGHRGGMPQLYRYVCKIF